MNNAKKTNQVPKSPPSGVGTVVTFWQDGDSLVTFWGLSRKPLSHNVERRASFGDFTGTRWRLSKPSDRSPQTFPAIFGSPEASITSLINISGRGVRSNGVGCLPVARKKTSLSYRLRVGSSVIENLTPEESLDLVLRVIRGDLEDDRNLNAPAPPSTPTTAAEPTTKGNQNVR